jgi:hypothetical protein
MSIFLALSAVVSAALLVPHVVSLLGDLNESRRCLKWPPCLAAGQVL